MTEKEPGYVYILTNPSFREDWVKIGKSSRPVDVRSKELDNTAVPLPFEIFAMCGIKIGVQVTFDPTGLVVKVAPDDSIEYEGRIYKLSPFVGTFMPEEHRNTSGAYQGAKYFSYNGKVLDEIRKEKETF